MRTTPARTTFWLVRTLFALTLGVALCAVVGCEQKAENEESATAEGEAADDKPGASEKADESATKAKLELIDADAKTLKSAIEAPGAKAVLVNAWATWCGPCVEEFPDLVKLKRGYSDKGLRLIFLSANAPEERPDVIEFLEEQKVTGKHYLASGSPDDLAGVLSEDWSGALPATFVFDGDGELQAFHPEDGDYGTFKKLVDAVLEGKTKKKSGDGLGLGDPIPKPDTKMKNVDGESVSIADVKGEKGTLVVVTCNHCPYVKAWEERITELGNTYDDEGIGVIAINPNDPEQQPEDAYEQMQKRAKKLGLEFPYVVDETSDVAKALGATKTPEAFLFDAEGKLVYHGAIDDNPHEPGKVEKQYLRDALDAVVAGEAPKVAESKSMGCSIKWRR